MYHIKKILNSEHIEHFEIDYMAEDPYYLQIRLYHETLETAQEIADIIYASNHQGKIHEVLMVYKPSQKTIDYCFSGVPHIAIDLEILLEKTTQLKHDYLLMDDDIHEF